MNRKLRYLQYAVGLLVLIVCGVTSVHAQPPAGTPRGSQSGERRRPRESAGQQSYDRGAVQQAAEQPLNSVLVRIRYKTVYGYKSESTEAGKPGLSSCDAFSVALAKPARPAVEGVLIPVRRPDRITEQYGYYFCDFLISGLATEQDVTISASVDDQGPWMGGPQSQLPANFQRALTDGRRTVTLTASEPRATMNFEMFYEARPDFLRPGRAADSIIRKP